MVAKSATKPSPAKPAASAGGMIKIFSRGEMIAERALGKAEKTYLASLAKEATHWPTESRRIVIECPDAAPKKK